MAANLACPTIPFQQFLKFSAVGGDEFLFQFTTFDLDSNIIVIRADKGAAALKVRDLHQLCFRKMQNGADALGFLILQIQDHLGLGVVDDALAVFAVLQREEVIEILRRADGRAAVAADDLENLQHKFRCQTVAAGADELPALVNEDGLFFGAVLLRLIPDKVQRHKHADGQKVAGQLRNIQNDVFVIERHVRLLVERFGRAADEPVQDVCQPQRGGRFLEHCVQIAQNWHFAVPLRVLGVAERVIVVRNAFFGIGTDHGFIEKLPFLMVHVGDQQAEKDV